MSATDDFYICKTFTSIVVNETTECKGVVKLIEPEPFADPDNPTITTISGGNIITESATISDTLLVGSIATIDTLESAGILTIQDSTQSTSKDTGCAVFEGGIGIEKNLTVGGNIILEGNDTVSGSGSGKDAINIETSVTHLDTSGGSSDLTLAAGVQGQTKLIVMTVGGNNAVLDSVDGNMTLDGSDTTITFNNVGQTIMLYYTGSTWVLTSSYGAIIS